MQAVPPDTKDWTWTLQRRCPDCGWTSSEVGLDEIITQAESGAAEWVQILTANPGVERRPSPDVWSPLEYGAHVRDVFGVFGVRLALMLDRDDPEFENWDQDQTAIEEDYATQNPDEVANELQSAADAFVSRLRAVTDDQLGRTGRRSNGSEFTVLTLSQYFLHDLVHHLWDVTGQRGTVETSK